MPDFFVPFDTTIYTDYYRNLVRKGLIYNYVLSYMDNNRNLLKEKFTDFNKFKTDFIVSDVMVDSLISLATKKGVAKKDDEIAKSKNNFKLITKAIIANNLWNNSEYWEILNPSRPEYMKAIEVLHNKKIYSKKLSK